jgi:hypothetical protein
MATFIDRVLAERRTLQQALADVRAKYERDHDPDLAQMILYGEAEILERTSKPAPNDRQDAACPLRARPAIGTACP